MAVKLIFVHALSALHAGTGQGVGTIDLPIAREKATKLPVVPGSSIKGCLKDACADVPEQEREAVFGKQDSAGLLQVADARLLLLPVRCLGASFVWTTSPYVLRRLRRDLEAAGTAKGVPTPPDVADGAALVATGDPLVTVNGKSRLVLEDLDFEASAKAGEWATWIAERLFAGDAVWQTEFRKRFAIIDDNSFHFLAEFATEVTAHVRIDHQTGTVETGALWYQEALAAETVLVSLLRAEERKGAMGASAVMAIACKPAYLQLGGKATTGQGLVRLATAGDGA
jgi:CRISPR-associated protein Cmr4